MLPATQRPRGAADDGRRDRRQIRVVLVMALALRLGLPAGSYLLSRDASLFSTPDSRHYMALAQSVAETGRYGGVGGPELFRPPGFPLLLAAGVLFGRPVLAAVLLHAALSTLTVWLVWRVGMRLADPRGAAWAAGICAVNPQLVAFSSTLLSETLATALVTLTVFLLLRATEGRRMSALAAAGIACAGIAYTRAAAYLLPLWLAPVLLMVDGSSRLRLRRVIRAGLFLLASVVTLAVWQVRNGLTGGYWGFSTQLDRAVYLITGAPILEKQHGLTYQQAREALLEDVGAAGIAGPEVPGPTHRTMRSAGLRSLLEAPLTIGLHHFRGIPVSLLDPGVGALRRLLGLAPTGLMGVAFQEGVVEAVRKLASQPIPLVCAAAGAAAFHAAFLCLTAIGLPRCVVRRPRQTMLSMAVIVYFVLTSGGPHATARYVLPIAPLMAVFAGAGVVQVTAWLRPGTAASESPP